MSDDDYIEDANGLKVFGIQIGARWYSARELRAMAEERDLQMQKMATSTLGEVRETVEHAQRLAAMREAGTLTYHVPTTLENGEKGMRQVAVTPELRSLVDKAIALLGSVR